MSRTKFSLALASLTTILMAPAMGHAQICASSTECPQGTTCQGSGATPTPETTAPCAQGAECPTKTAPPADLVARTSCQPAPCQVDADCGGEMVCYVQNYSTCSGEGSGAVACPPEKPCDVAPTPPPTTTCTQTSVSACAYRWQLPCNADADCGADFVCMPSVTGTCSGVAPTTGTGGGSTGATDVGGSTPGSGIAAPIPPAIDGGTTCTTTTSFPGYCQPRATTCASDADCPVKWTCVSQEVPVGTTRPTTGAQPADAPVSDVPAGERVAATKACQAPNAFPARGGGVSGDTGLPTTPPTTTGGEGAARASAGGGACALVPGQGGGAASALTLSALGLLGLVLRRSKRARR